MNFYDFEDQIKLYLKAAMAEQLFGTNIHAKIKGSADAMLNKVLELEKPMIRMGAAEEIESQN